MNISEEKVLQVTEVIEQEYENPFGIHVNKEKLVNISSGITLDDDIAESILNMVDVGKSRMKYFRQKGLISKDTSFHAPIKKGNYISFCHAMRKILITKKDGSAKVEEVSRNILEIMNSYSLKTGKPLDFQKARPFALFPVNLSISIPDGSRRHIAKSKLNDILLQYLENLTNEVSSRICNYFTYHP